MRVREGGGSRGCVRKEKKKKKHLQRTLVGGKSHGEGDREAGEGESVEGVRVERRNEGEWGWITRVLCRVVSR